MSKKFDSMVIGYIASIAATILLAILIGFGPLFQKKQAEKEFEINSQKYDYLQFQTGDILVETDKRWAKPGSVIYTNDNCVSFYDVEMDRKAKVCNARVLHIPIKEEVDE